MRERQSLRFTTKRHTAQAVRLSLLSGLLTALAVPASAADDIAFFKSKTVTYIVATAPGGGYDVYGRLVAQYMEKALPGSTFIVKNVPGAGHIIGANTIYGSRADGLTIGTFNTGLIYSQIANGKGVKFDLARMSWIGKASTEQRVMVGGIQSPFKSFADVQAATAANPVKISIGGVGSNTYVDTVIIARAFNLNFKIIPGYPGNEGEMAMRRGEIDATFGGIASFQQYVANGYGRFLLQTGGAAQAGLPQAATMVKDPDAKSLIALIDSQAEIGRLTAGPPDIPADRLGALRAAYKSALENPELQERAAKLDVPVTPLYGEDVAKLVRGALDQSPEMVKFVTEVTQPVDGK
jgi:tripartite-type tricarboxylate transporter receptor subunit TctC